MVSKMAAKNNSVQINFEPIFSNDSNQILQ